MGDYVILTLIAALLVLGGAVAGGVIVNDMLLEEGKTFQEVVTAEPTPTVTPQTEPKTYAFILGYDGEDRQDCAGTVYTVKPLPLNDSGFIAPFDVIFEREGFVGFGHSYYFRSSPLWNCSNVRQNVEAATR
jgi:hypothetical protein